MGKPQDSHMEWEYLNDGGHFACSEWGGGGNIRADLPPPTVIY